MSRDQVSFIASSLFWKRGRSASGPSGASALAGAALVLVGATFLWVPPAAAQIPGPGALIIDTDVGCDYDDPILVMAAANSPEVELVGITIMGKHNEKRSRIVRRILWLAGRPDVPVALGSEGPYDHDDLASVGEWSADFDLLPPLDTSAARFIVDRVLERPGEITVCVTGPATNFADALALAEQDGRQQEFVDALKCVILTGGSAEELEYNMYLDPASASKLVNCGATVFQMGQQTERVYLTHEDRARFWAIDTPMTRAMQELYAIWGKGFDPTAPYIPILYDVCPLMMFLPDGPYMEFQECRLKVRGDGLVKVDDSKTGHYWRTTQDVETIRDIARRRVAQRREPARRHLALARPDAPAEVQEELDWLLAAMDEPLSMEQAAEAARALTRVEEGWTGDAGREHLILARGYLAPAPRAVAYVDAHHTQPVDHVPTPPPSRIRRRHYAAGGLMLLLVVGGVAMWSRRGT